MPPAMFDPSKLDLDLNDQENTSDTPKTTPTPAEKKQDPLGDISVGDKSKKALSQDITPPPAPPLTGEGSLKWDKREDSQTQEPETKKNTTEVESTPKQILFDINITKLSDILHILEKQNYDFATLEPQQDRVVVSFKKEKTQKEEKNISYPVYSSILIQAKNASGLDASVSTEQQEWSKEITLKNAAYKIVCKIVPSALGEKIFLKIKKIEKKVTPTKKEPVSFSQILTFFWAILFVAVILGGGFISFIALNATTVQDVQFFASLGIDLGEINRFIQSVVTISFSLLVFLETIFLVIYLFKFALTKKIFKQKKVRSWMIAVFFFILTFITGSTWIFIDQVVDNLPDWENKSRWEIQLYYNSRLKSEYFDLNSSLIRASDTTSLIGPMEIKYDVSVLAQNESEKWFEIQKYIWDFGTRSTRETGEASIIHEFEDSWAYTPELTLVGLDFNGQLIEKTVENIPTVNINYEVDIVERKLEKSGTLVEFDATDLKQLWQVEWYFIENLETPAFVGYEFKTPKKQTEQVIAIHIIRNDTPSDQIDKVFIIPGESENAISGEISYQRSIENDLEFDLQVENIESEFGNGFIEEYRWIIWDKEFTTVWDIENPTESSKITHTFSEYGDQEVRVIMTNSSGQEQEIISNIEIPKTLKLRDTLSISESGEEIENIIYEPATREYYIRDIGIPTKLEIDAKQIRPSNIKYTLSEVRWDTNNDGNTDEKWKTLTMPLYTEQDYVVWVEYVFKNRVVPDELISVFETLFIEWIEKDVIVHVGVTQESEYAPTTVRFDASRSRIKNGNIAKFIWDYGDGIIQEADAIIPAHRYSAPGEYDVVVTVVSDTWEKQSINKKVILKPKPERAEITTSLKNTITYQSIDFSSNKSEGQISAYYWDFGDGTNSTEANPSHLYKKPGKYEVKLTLDFSNKNTLSDTVEIQISEG